MADTASRRRAALSALVQARDRQARATADRFLLVAAFADEYLEVEDSPALHGERLVPLGGDGCPEVAEFAALELSARLGMRPESAAALMASALSVRHRLPDFWRLVDDLRLPVWLAQDLAEITRELPLHQCLAVSSELAPLVGRIGQRALKDQARATVLALLSEEASTQRKAERAQRRVRFWHQDHVAGLDALLDRTDALWLDAQLDRIATILGAGGDTDSRDVRRSKALGVLASPARALQLLQASLPDQNFSDQGLPLDLDTSCPAAGQRGHLCGQVTVDPDRLLPRAQVVVHLTDVTLAQGRGLVRGETLGPLLASWTRELLGHSRVAVRPVLDVGALAPCSAYEVPERLREVVVLRNPTSVFPFSIRRSRGLDLDHTTPYRTNGPPGQTAPGNLGPLTRKEHRAKTHGGWHVQQPEPGTFSWTSPLGHRYLVTPSGTACLDDPYDPEAEWSSLDEQWCRDAFSGSSPQAADESTRRAARPGSG